MNILYLLNSGKPGGMEQHVVDLAREMHERGHKVYVWCREGEIVGWFKTAGAEVTLKNINLDIDPPYILNLVTFLKTHHIDIIHSHELKSSTNALFAGWFAGTKVKLTHIHTPMSHWQVGSVKRMFNKIKQFGYSTLIKLFATREIALTEYIKEVKISEGIPESKLVVIPNGLQLENYTVTSQQKTQYRKEVLQKYAIPDNAFVFGCVGRFTEEKGHKLLVDAFAEILQHPAFAKETVHLLLAGGGTLEEQLNTQIKTLGISEKVTITGIFEATEKIKLFSAMDIFVFPTLAEGFGIVLIEAMALGVPCIVSDLEVLQEVGGSNCFYFEQGNVVSLKEKMLDMYLKRNNLANIKSASVQRVQDLFSMTKFADAYEQLYFELLETK